MIENSQIPPSLDSDTKENQPPILDRDIQETPKQSSAKTVPLDLDHNNQSGTKSTKSHKYTFRKRDETKMRLQKMGQEEDADYYRYSRTSKKIKKSNNVKDFPNKEFFKSMKKNSKKKTLGKSMKHDDDESFDEIEDKRKYFPEKRTVKEEEYESEDEWGHNIAIYDNVVMAKLPTSIATLEEKDRDIDRRIKKQKNQYKDEAEKNAQIESFCPKNSVPLNGDVRYYQFQKLAEAQLQASNGRLFDVIMMDPPWQLSSSNPNRGVAIGYDSLADECISNLPIGRLQKAGFLFIWVINAKYSWTCEQMDKWGYKLVDEVSWIKKTVTGKIAPGHGFYQQHAKETCLVGVKGEGKFQYQSNVGSDVIFSERRGQSQKPNEIYELIEKLVPNGYYLEIFGRRNNLRDRWVTLGNEL